jgi:hypothetical protein
MNFLFGYPIKIIDNLLNEEDRQTLIEEILCDHEKDYPHPQVNCSCETSILRRDWVNYPIDRFSEEYVILTQELNFQKHSYFINEPWWNYYTEGTGQDPHYHIAPVQQDHVLFAGVYFVDGCENTELIMMNPSMTHHYHNGIRKNLFREEMSQSSYYCRWHHTPRDNQLILFPADLLHYVPFHKCERPRISVAFNIHLDTK